ncbi:hypothetical protein ACOMHN_045153 [Nucella lapillus]
MASNLEMNKQRSDLSAGAENPLSERPSYVRSDSRQSARTKPATDGRSAPRRPKLDRLSSFDLHHVDSVPSRPDLRRLGSINLKDVPWWTSQRLQLSVLCFLGFLVLYAQRVNLSIAIVSMVRDQANPLPPGLNATANWTLVVDAVYPDTLGANGSTSPASECPELKRVDKERGIRGIHCC